MASILRIFQNEALIAAGLAWLSAELIKFIIRFFYVGERTWARLWSSGGMPSAHSATVCGLATAIGLRHGFDGYAFALAMVLAMVVMYDACGVRRAAGEQAKILNELGDMLMSKNLTPEEKLHEFIGHTPIQVIAGAIWGITVAALFVLLR